MIRVFKGESPDRLEGESCRRRVQTNVENGTFGGSFCENPEVKASLRESLHGKCVYCEIIPEGATPEVEHYRPKGGIAADPNHKGYYWLGHEWNNLLLACPTCNSNGKKGTQFPIKGTRVYEPILNEEGGFDRSCTIPTQAPLADEKPLLLNPAWEDPLPHLKFNADGTIEGRTERGVKTIEVCQLNRGDLIVGRKKVVDNYLTDLNKILDIFINADFSADNADVMDLWRSLLRSFLQNWLDKIINETSETHKFAGFRRQAFWKYEQFYVQQLSGDGQRFIRELFESRPLFSLPIWLVAGSARDIDGDRGTGISLSM